MHELAETSYRAAAMRNGALIESLTALETIKTQCAEGPYRRSGKHHSLPVPHQRADPLLSASAMNRSGGDPAGGQRRAHHRRCLSHPRRSISAWGPYRRDHAWRPRHHAARPGRRAADAVPECRTALESLEKLMANPVERGDDEFIHRPELGLAKSSSATSPSPIPARPSRR